MSFIIEDYMINELSLSGNDLLVFAFLSAKGVGKCSVRTIRRGVGVSSDTTIRNTLKHLEEKGLITITSSKGDREPNTIEVLYSPQNFDTETHQESVEKFSPSKHLHRRVGRELLD